MADRIYLSPPDIGEDEVNAVVDALRSGWIAPVGPELDAFEADVAAVTGVPHAVALASGTAALHLALLALGVGPGDDVFVPTLTFIAPANAVVYCGARPVFIDSEETTWNVSAALVAEELGRRRRLNQLPKAMVVVDLYGRCADYDPIVSLCRELGVPVVEDAAEALGASYRGQPAGSLGDLGVLSFNGNKIITTSGGGMLLCRDGALADRIRYLAAQARQPVPHYEHTEVGFNYRLSNILAALGRAQLSRLSQRVERRAHIHRRYRAALGGLVEFPDEGACGRSNHWLTSVLLPERGPQPADVVAAMDRDGIEARRIWKPMHLQPVFADAPGVLNGTADGLYARGLCLPSGSGLDALGQDRVISALRDLLVPPRAG